MRKYISILLISTGLGVVCCVAWFLPQHHTDYGTVLDVPRTIKPFTLEGTDLKPFTQNSLSGHWTMMFFGFTSCTSICPTTMMHLAQMINILHARKVPVIPRVIMISVDTQGDTLEKLTKYVTAFNPNFYGARGDQHTVRQLANELGIAYAKFKNDTNHAGVYDIQHSGAVLLFNPHAKLAAFFTSTSNPRLLANNYIQLIN